MLNKVEGEPNIGPSRNYVVEAEFSVPLWSEFMLSGGVGTTRAIWGNAFYADPQLTAAAQAVNPAAPPVIRNLNGLTAPLDRKSTRLNSSHSQISYAVFCLKKKKKNHNAT